ncbi:RagB/SusD family nutrient uptake outer membrane protein [Flavobacterium caseinilyticum]|uniref:RagB/SusD family nutrient uptake outer membrane protein n=1 Tax=Flavobacterium caseinilyticum TaxID=2541732 RepID=A0A4R5B2Q1_9FLAO|nr:RagB/SusD family nutrient uptake outer membrane protein [Flavobacterium caseinilyticum]TDD77342.1 RagB/SusD family nutrient uptake outer membrane protein [Flavobacterium caseinilyticum]
MKKILIPMTLAAVALLSTNCSNDFIEVAPTENIAEADLLSIYNNNDGAKSFVTAIYSNALSFNASSFAWNGLTSMTSDDADKGSDPGDTGADKDKLDALTMDATSLSVEQVFETNYQGISKANIALNYLPKLDKADAAVVSRLTGEAKFLRALMYFNLVRCYGGVPIVDRVPVPSSVEDTDMTLIRKSKEDVYKFIETDLLAAIGALPEKSGYASSDLGRATKGAAHALLAKVYLYQRNWQGVKDQSAAVTGYNLVNDYATIWREIGEDSVESIFEIRGYGGNPSQGIEGYMVSQGARGTSGWGWGFNTPTESLTNSYEAGDVRKDATIIFAGETMWDGRVVSPLVANPRYNEKAYVSNTKETFNGDWETTKNIRVLRYAEVLLMQAEAANESGTGDVTGPLNKVRNRAGLANTTATGQVALRAAIRAERRHELAFEHDRWFDIVRTGQAKSVMAADGKTFVEGKHELFPIPQKFITQSNGKSTQNPGY